MDIESGKVGDIVIITPRGRFDTNNAPQAEKLVLDSIVAGEKRMIFNFEGTDYISSAGLRVILQAAKLVRKNGRVVLCNANEQIREVLEISGFLDMITYCKNLREARKSAAE
ncbi:MAG TPA: anti-sigma factor antagonist [Gammaproteobacteria bacterium]|nr:anti-sigma factor antagonist [Gammaproteobacteria bacterium]